MPHGPMEGRTLPQVLEPAGGMGPPHFFAT